MPNMLNMPNIPIKDLQMSYRDQGDLAAPAVVLIHGNVSSSAWWEYTFARLQNSPYRLIAPDLRGRGHTTGPDDTWTIETLADDIHHLLTALGVGRAHFVGHSLGGVVAIQYTLDHPDSVRSLYLLAPGWVKGDMPAAVGDPARIKMLVENKAILKMALRATASTHPDEGWEFFEAASMLQTDAASLRSPQALFAWNVYARLGSLAGIPTTISRGAGDVIVPESVVMDSVNGIPGAKYEVFQGATHSPNIETPDAFAVSLLHHLHSANA